jgi:hypothetical protein
MCRGDLPGEDAVEATGDGELATVIGREIAQGENLDGHQERARSVAASGAVASADSAYA